MPDLSKVYQETCCNPMNKGCVCGKQENMMINEFIN
jgi:hypothetical protein